MSLSSMERFKADVTATYLTLMTGADRLVALHVIFQKPASRLVEEFYHRTDDVPMANEALRVQVKDLLTRTSKIKSSILPGELVDEWDALQPQLEIEKKARDNTIDFHEVIDLTTPVLGEGDKFSKIPFSKTRGILVHWDTALTKVAPMRVVECRAVPKPMDVNLRKYHKIGVDSDFIYN